MITISLNGGGIRFQFDGNQRYLFDGIIDVPVNSLSLVLEEDSFTFYKAASNDLFISGRYEDLGWTKEELESFYKNSMVASNGGSSIREIYVGTSGDSVSPDDCIVTKLEGDKQWLNIVYEDQQGRCSLVKISLNEFIVEQEFQDGLYVDSGGTVHGAVDPRSEWVFIDYNASGFPTTSGEVLTVNASGFTVHNIQTAIDEKAKAVVKKVEEQAEYVWDSTENKMVLRLRDLDEVILNDIEFFDTNNDGDILLPSRTF